MVNDCCHVFGSGIQVVEDIYLLCISLTVSCVMSYQDEREWVGGGEENQLSKQVAETS
jgi:hypothetical protein